MHEIEISNKKINDEQNKTTNLKQINIESD